MLEMLRRGGVLFSSGGDENLAGLANGGGVVKRAASSGATIEEIEEDDVELPVVAKGGDAKERDDTAHAGEPADTPDISSALVVGPRRNKNNTSNSNSGDAGERPAAPSASAVDLQLDDADDAAVQQIVMQLAAEAERMKAYLAEQELAFRRESDFVDQLRREHKALKELARDYKYRARLRRRVERAEHDAKRAGRSGKSSGSSSKRRLKKQARLLHQTRREAVQNLELLQSKNVNYEMELERQMAELRREHEVNFFLM